jgi:ribosomal protein S18 acetylase RimI-like enzyme
MVVMPLRAFKLPDDLPALIDLIPPSFQYPENEAWSMQEEEVTSFVDTMKGFRRMWPLLRLAQLLVPPLRDAFLGYIWEEDGKPVGLSNVLRQGATDRWYIGNVAVLPEYRRRGIARQLVEACMGLAKERGAKALILDVVAENVPAYSLYKRLGFEHFSSNSELSYEDSTAPPAVPELPGGYTLAPQPLRAWRERYALAQRITPETIRHYIPVREERFRQPLFLHMITPLLRLATGMDAHAFAARANGSMVAHALSSTRRRAGGMNSITLSLDPAHADLALPLIGFLVSDVHRRSPGRRLDIHVQHWQDCVLQAAGEIGFVKRVDYHTLGMLIEQDVDR